MSDGPVDFGAQALAPSELPGLVRPRAILYDWDNTLVDTWPVIHAALHDLFVAMGREPWTLAQTKARVRHSLRDSFPVLFGARWEEAAAIFYDAFEKRHLAALAPLPGAEALLRGLAAAGVAQGVVSNKTGRYLRAETAHLGWDSWIGAQVGAGDAARDKPAVDPVRQALAAMGHCDPVTAETVWFVGDSGVDMEIAHAAGCLPVLVRPEAGPSGEFETFAPALHLPDCAAVHDLVTRL